MTIDRGVTWTSQINRLKKKLLAFVLLIRFVSGTTWGPLSHLRLHQALFVGLLRYGLPILNYICKTNIRTLLAFQARTLRACLALPRSSSTTGSIVKSRQLPFHALQVQETLRLHFRHLSRHESHYLAKLLTERKSSPYAKLLSGC